MREVELKALVPDPDDARARLERAGARLVYEGRLEDRRYDAPDRSLAARDHVLRLRVYRDAASGAVRSAALDWKGPTGYENGYEGYGKIIVLDLPGPYSANACPSALASPTTPSEGL